MENTETNPYQAPESDLETGTPEQNLQFGEPQKKPTGHGWQWIKSGFDLFKRSPGGWILTMVVGFLIMLAINIIPIVGNIIIMLTTYVWTAGIMYGCSQLEQGSKFKLSYLFAGFKLAPGKLIALSVVLGLFGFVIALACLGTVYIDMLSGNAEQPFAGQNATSILISILIMVALYVPLMMAAWFAPLLVIFHNYSVFSALKSSFFACLKNLMPFLVYGLIGFLLLFVAALPVGLGLLIMFPVLYASMYTAYKDIYLQADTMHL
ncbi:BPSS1780 family membrane protein [Catenovulum adriaticum]|uniref:BPSS1780 family membrane protein n=1 Tax=Catenovulum adriaticum TaxID=2984846 RepID=A0ABY7AS81_9ALTE|nr:BPSS1780 family membrane protein [Catenovulum sp. TS8]WAJ72180.1 BPSS1780 family membrane protein [Catenovulum sp. TS8]